MSLERSRNFIRKFKLRKPGAHHHTRFMAYLIYILKMELLSERYHPGREDASQLHRMASCVALFHCRAFLQSSLSVIAPALDLKFLVWMDVYAEHDQLVADTANKSMKNHLWHLTVVFAIFDEDIPHAIRKATVDKLLCFPRPQRLIPAKPKFPSIMNLSLTDYPQQLLPSVGPRSGLLFVLLKMDDAGFCRLLDQNGGI